MIINHHQNETSNDMPMSYPDLMLASHKCKDGHNVSLTKLADGRILRLGKGFFYSEDGGLSWSDPFIPKDKNGIEIKGGSSLLSLDNGTVLGMASIVKDDVDEGEPGCCAMFRKSFDGGLSWSDPVRISPPGMDVKALQDVLIQTSSNRLVYPCYISIGQGHFHRDDAPFVGGYVKGNFISTDSHFFDPHFGATVVFYSDDEGKTWKRNQDGEIFILLPETGAFEPTFEPSVIEVTPGKLLMMFRTRLGRYFQAWSYDEGNSWCSPQATQLAGCHAPCQIRKFPNSGNNFNNALIPCSGEKRSRKT